MSSSPKSVNAKSQSLTARIPHEVMEGMDAVKTEGESTAAFVVASMRGEIARRQLKESGEDKLLSNLNSALETLSKIEQAGTLASESLQGIIGAAQSEIKLLQGKQMSTAASEPPAPPVEESLGHRIRRSKF